jgi:uncharacterized protein (DUF3084 family)
MTDRRHPAGVALLATAIVFFLAASTFGTLWVLELAGHGTASGQLTDVRAQIDRTKAQLWDAEEVRKANTARAEAARTKSGGARAIRDRYKDCLDHAKAMVAAADARDDKKFTEAWDTTYRHCV